MGFSLERNFAVLVCTIACQFCVEFAGAGEEPRTPHQVIAELQQRMYAIGETTGRYADFIDAEQNAALAIRAYVKDGDSAALVEKNKSGDSPLMASAQMGYSSVVAELLKSEKVRLEIGAANPNGMSAWIYANMALRQAIWVCNPTVFKNPFSWVPVFVTQPYYLESAENPYKKTRRLLESAGARADMSRAKVVWQDTCKLQSDATRSRVQSSDDLLETVLKEGTEELKRFVVDQQAAKKK
jgi:hypothetical protein